MFINHTSKQVTAKIVYYGTGLGGKTTNLQYIFSVTNPRTRGELISMETEIERTLFFDLLPINVGLVKGYQTKFQLYTVPGQVFYDSTRKLVLKGADGVVFVADSQELMEQANLESFENLKNNLVFHNQNIEEMPMVFQYNKRDLKNIMSMEKLNSGLNHLHQPYFEAVASSGHGVIETLRDISSLTLVKIKEALEHATVSAQNVAVNFDVDSSSKIYKLKDLPMKKISMETIPVIESDQAPFPGNETASPASDQALLPEDEIVLTASDQVLLTENEIVSSASVQASLPKNETAAPVLVQEEAGVKNEKINQDKQISKSLGSLLSKFEDPTRITKIEKITGADGRLNIDIKGNDGRLLSSFAVELHSETKKVNIILDVKN
jgi:mutual gliding-motility protein MglA